MSAQGHWLCPQEAAPGPQLSTRAPPRSGRLTGTPAPRPPGTELANCSFGMFPRLTAGNRSSCCPPGMAGMESGWGVHSRPLLGPQTFWSHATLVATQTGPLLTFCRSHGYQPERRAAWGLLWKTTYSVGHHPAPPATSVPGRSGGRAGGTSSLRGSRARRRRAARRRGSPRREGQSHRSPAAGFRPRRTPRPPACQSSRGAEGVVSTSPSPALQGPRERGPHWFSFFLKVPPRRIATSSGTGEGDRGTAKESTPKRNSPSLQAALRSVLSRIKGRPAGPWEAETSLSTPYTWPPKRIYTPPPWAWHLSHPK